MWWEREEKKEKTKRDIPMGVKGMVYVHHEIASKEGYLESLCACSDISWLLPMSLEVFSVRAGPEEGR